MLNNIKKQLIIAPMIAFLSISYMGTMAKAEDKANQNNVIESNRQNGESVNSVGTKTDNNSNTASTNLNNSNSTTTSNSSQSSSDIKDEKNSGKSDEENNKETSVISETPQWMNINGKLYYVTKDGIAKNTGWFTESDVNPDSKNESEYYLDKDHAAVTGWKKIDKDWYYFNEAGVKQTGWNCVKGVMYHFDQCGIMQTGWLKDNGNKYYLDENGAMCVGKKYIDNNWYFFGASGILQTNYYFNNGKLYYSNKDGIMEANKWLNTANGKYYVKADSSLATGYAIIDNVAQQFGNNGKYIGPTEMKDRLYIKYLSVGDADCTFIKLPNGKSVLIDTGTPETSQKVMDFLKDQRLRKEDDKEVIDYIIITHAHSDHIGGLASILENFKVKKVYMPNTAVMKDWYSNVKVTTQNAASIKMMKTDYEVYEEAVKAMKDNNIEFTDTKKGEYIDEDKILEFVQSDKNFGPIGSEKIAEYYWGINENSAIVYLNYGDLQALFAADMEWNSEKEFWQDNLLDDRKVDVLKVSHHGSDTSSTKDFLAYLKPAIGIISRSKESIRQGTAYNNLISNGISLYETSEKDGVSIYATQGNWTLGN